MVIFFFKQKTAYEMRISDWSSDVCSSDLFPGSTGGIYRQFSVTLIVSIGFSALLALTLTPALCATFLKPHVPEDQRKENWFTRRTGRFFTGFNNWFGRTTDRYQGGVSDLVATAALALNIHRVGRPDGHLVHASPWRLPSAGGPGRCHHRCTGASRRDP